VTAGFGALAMGSDLSGSIRIPAHFCGIYGHKPSLGLVSTDGFQPVHGMEIRVRRWISRCWARWPEARAI
jgi:Asp-tRNA(Asn)/Glu-tRNA(Gln) amidotransferase A subunit family amidase